MHSPRQLPFAHTCPSSHAISHAPQCVASRRKSTHAPPQSVIGASQLPAHLPFAHTSPAAHATPQPPQFAGSLATPVHTPSQTIEPAAQLDTHLLATHSCPSPHLTSQAPQFAASVVASTHLSPQSTSRPTQVGFGVHWASAVKSTKMDRTNRLGCLTIVFSGTSTGRRAAPRAERVNPFETAA
jgi:hypothetical protein